MTKVLILATAFYSCSIVQVFAQSNKIAPSEKKELLHESVDDPYLPNAFQNKKTAPAYRFNSSQIAKRKQVISTNASNSSVFTAQVNVNSIGQNIIGDAANEPSIGVNWKQPGNITIGWRQFDNVLSNFRQAGVAFTSDSGQTWSFTGVIEPGIFRSDPVLDTDTGGNFYYNSLTNNPNFFCRVFKSTNGGAAWDTGVAAAGGDKQWMVIDRTNGASNGNIYSSWNAAFSTCVPYNFTRSQNNGSSFDTCTLVDNEPFWNTMALGTSGELYIAGANALNDSLLLCKSITAQIAGAPIIWEPPSYIFMDGGVQGFTPINPQGLMGQVNVDVDVSNGAGQGNVYVLASVFRNSNFDPGDVMFVRSSDGGVTWSAPIRINDDNSFTNTQWFGTMSVAPNGRIDVIWLDTRDGSGTDSSALYYSYSIDQGLTWSLNEKLSPNFDPHVGYPNQNKMGDYFDMVSDSNGAHLAWANTLNGEQDVYYSYIQPPVGTTIQLLSKVQEFKVSPIPSNGIIYFKNNFGIQQIELIDLVGISLANQNISSGNVSLDFSAYPKGAYLLKAKGKDEVVYSTKILLN